MKKIYTVLIILLISAAIGVALGLSIYAVCSPKNNSSSDDSESSTSVEESDDISESSTSTEESSEIIEPSEPKEEDILYADDSGKLYKILSITTAKDGRVLIIIQNVETGGVLMTVKSYFDQNFHQVEEQP